MTNETVISAKSLDLTFQTNDGPVHALKDVNLNITKGEFVSFIGPSGCGKTTILRIIAGLENVTSGYVFLEDDEITHLNPTKRDISLLAA